MKSFALLLILVYPFSFLAQTDQYFNAYEGDLSFHLWLHEDSSFCLEWIWHAEKIEDFNLGICTGLFESKGDKLLLRTHSYQSEIGTYHLAPPSKLIFLDEMIMEKISKKKLRFLAPFSPFEENSQELKRKRYFNCPIHKSCFLY